MITDDPRTYAESGWDFLVSDDPREHFAKFRKRVDPRRATPFLGDFQLRSRFNNVKTRDYL